MSGLTVKITGAKQLERALEQFTPATGRAVLRRALKKAAKPIQIAAKQYAPYADGNLEKSIKIKTHDAGKGAFAGVMRGGGTKQQAVTASRNARRDAPVAEVLVIAQSPIGHLVEFGTDERFQGNGKSTGAMPPDPFMRPAFDAKGTVAASIIHREITEEIDRTASRIAAKALAKR